MPKYTAQRITSSGPVGLPVFIVPKQRPKESAKSAAFRATHVDIKPHSGDWVDVNEITEKA